MVRSLVSSRGSSTCESRASPRGAIRAPALACLLAVCSGCATQAFAPELIELSPFMQRGISHGDDAIVVTAAVPTATEVESLVGIDLHDDGIQPVWLEIENNGDSGVRVALTSIDEDYFPPLEVSWQYRKRFGTDYRQALDRWFYENGMPRRIAAGETRSGFVYTRLSEGTKSFNIDVFSSLGSSQFTFFVPRPGFDPDYLSVDFHSLYDASDVTTTDIDGLRSLISNWPCCTTDESGEALGDPFNVVIVGTPQAVRRSLLRGEWLETEIGSPATRMARTHYFQGRYPDGTFHNSRPDGGENKELRLWLAPVLVEGLTVWLGQVSYDMSGNLFARKFSDRRIDPDLDAARMFLVQNLWYGQSLRAVTMASGVPRAPIAKPNTNFHGAEYFTDGLRAVLFVSEMPVAMDETELISWEKSR